jgi:hypothetical protein
VVGIDVQGDTNGLCIIENSVDLSINAAQNVTDIYLALLIGRYADSNGTTATIIKEANVFSEEERIENTETARRRLLRIVGHQQRDTGIGSLEWEVHRGRRVLTEEELMNAGGCPFASGGGTRGY